MKSGDLGGLRSVVEEDRQQRAATVLVDVAYVIDAHFELTAKAGPDDNEGKHLDSFNRRARKGQCFHQPCLGTREFPRAVSPDRARRGPAARRSTKTRDLGFMLYDIDHGGDRARCSSAPSLENGVMRVPAPDLAGDSPMSVLASLVRAYERLPDAPAFGYSVEKIGFLISLNADGSPAGPPIDLREGEGKKKTPRLMQVPASFKRPGITPRSFFLWDNTAFALGVIGRRKEGGPPTRLEAFRELHRRELAGTDDPG